MREAPSRQELEAAHCLRTRDRREHLLLLSMLQRANGTWSWGRYVVVHPADNTDYGDACALYRGLLEDESTFSSLRTEELFAADVLSPPTTAALRERYTLG